MKTKEVLINLITWLSIRKLTLTISFINIGLFLYIDRESNPDFILRHGSIYEMIYDYFCLVLSLFGLCFRVYYSMLSLPKYLGNFIICLGIAMLTANPLLIIILCIGFWVYYKKINNFGKLFAAGKLIKPDINYKWINILDKEKENLLIITLIFAGYDIFGQLISGDNKFNYIFEAICLLATIQYLILNILKYKGYIK